MKRSSDPNTARCSIRLPVPGLILGEYSNGSSDHRDSPSNIRTKGSSSRVQPSVDTAGARKRKSFADDIEFYAHTRMQASMKRADVVLLMLDATAEVSQSTVQ